MGKSAPKAPDPYKVADAQTKSNVATAQEQARLAMSGQTTPWGSLQFVSDPSSPSGYRAVTQLSPEEQALMGLSQDLQANYGSLAGEQLGRVGETMGADFDLNAARASEISDMQRGFLDPQWAAREDDLRTSLLNRGVREGSEQWARAMRDFESSRSDAYDRMFLDAYDKANRSALTERNLPMADLASLGIGAFPFPDQGMNFASTPTPGVAPTDVAGPVMQSYAQQMQAYNQQMGGLFGIGSNVLGGWAMNGFPGLAAISDRRVKTDIKKIGDDPRGWGVYLFRYIWDDLKGIAKTQIGYMAQEVEKFRPDAVLTNDAGVKAVNYDALALA